MQHYSYDFSAAFLHRFTKQYPPSW